ncbi:hypothetical protein JTB14_027714 [Gonioctena quinquepunctata]|nr:hypothetical protein JTB14_027714 [Gonioctena quinquepunctata]
MVPKCISCEEKFIENQPRSFHRFPEEPRRTQWSSFLGLEGVDTIVAKCFLNLVDVNTAASLASPSAFLASFLITELPVMGFSLPDNPNKNGLLPRLEFSLRLTINLID